MATDFYLLDERLTDEERAVRDRLRAFCDREVTPVINGYWERETAKWLPHRSVAVIQGRMPVPPTAEITILNYEVVAAHRETLGRMSAWWRAT